MSFVGFQAVLLFLALPGGLLADWIEQGDAGSLIQDAQEVKGRGQPLGVIQGFLGVDDQDMFLIYIRDPQAFMATTVGGSSVDTQLFLFGGFIPVRPTHSLRFPPWGGGVYANDDTGGFGGAQSTLPAGHMFSPPLPGYYYLAISVADADPLGFGGGLMFPSSPSTGVFGPIDDRTIESWSGGGGEGGSYVIYLQGASDTNPEPGMLGLLAVGLVVLVARRRRHP
jgi:MYXO-CTERM domain-containing protein